MLCATARVQYMTEVEGTGKMPAFPRIGGMLLAAGGSSRFGSPKQLALFQGKTLLRRAAETIVASGCSTIVVVLGACAEACKEEIEGLELNIVVNDQWETGMASSIKTGLAKLIALGPDIDAVLITLMDQTLITSEHLAKFAGVFNSSQSPIIAARYSDILGAPALFSRETFNNLLQLKGDEGARSIIRKSPGVTIVELREAAVDVDEIRDLKT